MKFGEIVEKLQAENPEYVILIRCGIFYQAIEADALIIEKEIGGNKICFRKNTCKIGIPKETIKYVTEKLQKLGYKYIVYQYIAGDNLNTEEKYIEEYRYDKGNINKIKIAKNLEVDCNNCKYGKRVKRRNSKDILQESQLIIKEMEKESKKLNRKKEITRGNKMVALMVKNFINELLDDYIKGDIYGK